MTLKVHNGTVHYRSKEEENNKNNSKEKESLSSKDPLLQFDLNSDNFDLPVNDKKKAHKEANRKKCKQRQMEKNSAKLRKNRKCPEKWMSKYVTSLLSIT